MQKNVKLSLLLTILALLIAACAAPEPEVVIQEVIKEVEVEKIVEVEVEVEKEVEVEVIKEVEKVVEVEVEKIVEVAAPDMPEGELIVAITTFPNAITPPNAAERQASTVSKQWFNGLVWLDEDKNIVPALATEWEISDDGTEYTFKLREGVTFHNGETLNAEDVATTYAAGQDPANAYAYLYEPTTVEIIDDMTVKLISDEPDPLFLAQLADVGIYPTDYYNEVGFEGFEAFPIGTGPFKFVEWVKGERIVFEAYEDYWEEGLPKVARLVFRPIPESATRLAAVQTGEIHIATRLVAEEADQLLGNPKVNVISYLNDRSYYIAFNNLSSGIGQPTEDPLVRRALNYAVDMEAIVDAFFDGKATRSSGMVSTANIGYDSSLDPYPYDPDKAVELMTEAGFPDGFEIGFACPIGAYPNFEDVCQAIGGYLEAVGVSLEGGEVQFLESGQYWDLESKKELPPLFGDAWSVEVSEALDRLEGSLFEEASYAAWEDPELRTLIEAAGSELDVDVRTGIYTEIHNYMYDNPPFIYLYYPNVFEAVNGAVQNYTPRASETYYLKNVFVATDN